LKKIKTEPYNKCWQNLIPWLGVYLIITIMMMIDGYHGGDHDGGGGDGDDEYEWNN